MQCNDKSVQHATIAQGVDQTILDRQLDTTEGKIAIYINHS